MAHATVTPNGLELRHQPALIQAGALHYFRLPHPSLWRPVLERMRMGGLNAVMVPIPWAYHAPAPGFYDFTGPRDLLQLLDMVEEVGLWLVPHIGPWVGAGLDAGGIPAWLLRSPEMRPHCGDDAPEGSSEAHPEAFLRQVEMWWARLVGYISERSNLLFVMLNGGMCDGSDGEAWPLPGSASTLYRLARRLGIEVPCALPYVEDKMRASGEDADLSQSPPHGERSTTWADGSFATTASPASPASTSSLTADAFAYVSIQVVETDVADLRLPEAVRLVVLETDFVEKQVGSRRGRADDILGPDFPRPWLAAIAGEGVKMTVMSPYHHGVNWGWWGAPGAETGHGDGAPLTPGHSLSARYHLARRMALTLETVGQILRTSDEASDVRADTAEHLIGSVGGRYGSVAFLLGNRYVESYAHLTLDRGAKQVTVEDIPLPPRAARTIPLDWRISGARVVGTTMEPIFRTTVAGRELIILLNEVGGDVMLPSDLRPRHRRGPVYPERHSTGLAVHFDPTRLSSLLLDGPGGVLQLLALGPALATRVWPLDDVWRTTPILAAHWDPAAEEPVVGVVLGPEFVVPERDGGFRFLVSEKGFGYRWGPWRGSDPHTWLAPISWRAPAPVRLPSLTWSSRPGAPEVEVNYNDRGWRRVAPAGPFDMEAQGVDYGFIWYRGHFRGPATSLTLTCRHACDVFLNGAHIATLNPPPDLGPAVPKRLPLPSRHLREENLLALLVENLGRPGVWTQAVEPHGLIACAIDGATDVDWRVRGGLSGESRQQGFYGFVEGAMVPDRGSEAVTWHRATFAFSVPADLEVPVYLYLDRTPTKAYIYLNGQLIGRSWYPRSRERRFWLPDGLLRRDSTNELLIAQWLRGADPGIGTAQLEVGTVRAWYREAGA